jgi:hypothetical protein
MERQLKPADQVEVTVPVDNYIDIFVPQSTPVDPRLPTNPGRPDNAPAPFPNLYQNPAPDNTIWNGSMPLQRGGCKGWATGIL